MDINTHLQRLASIQGLAMLDEEKRKELFGKLVEVFLQRVFVAAAETLNDQQSAEAERIMDTEGGEKLVEYLETNVKELDSIAALEVDKLIEQSVAVLAG